MHTLLILHKVYLWLSLCNHTLFGFSDKPAPTSIRFYKALPKLGRTIPSLGTRGKRKHCSCNIRRLQCRRWSLGKKHYVGVLGSFKCFEWTAQHYFVVKVCLTWINASARHLEHSIRCERRIVAARLLPRQLPIPQHCSQTFRSTFKSSAYKNL